MITSMYDAEYGRAGGAIVNAVTKSGTNTFSGVVFGYVASNALTSKDVFARQRRLAKAEVEERYANKWSGPSRTRCRSRAARPPIRPTGTRISS